MQADKGVMLPRHTLLKGTVGSQAYGLATTGSDVDELGVFAYDTPVFLGIEPPSAHLMTIVTTQPDVTMHEAAKFCRLALSCNPSAMELLWLKSYSEITTLGGELLARRERFLSAPQIQTVYTNFVHSQVRKIERLTSRPDGRTDNHDKIAKLARHLLRLVEQGTGLWVTGQLELLVRSAPDTHKFGELVAEGNVSMVYPLLARLHQTFEACRPRVPAASDRAAIQRWLTNVRDTFFYSAQERK